MAHSAPEQIWFKDPRGFFADDRLAHFLPERHTSLAAQLNALLRLALYSSVIMILFHHYTLATYIPIGTAALTYAMYASNTSSGKINVPSREGMTREGRACTIPTHSNPYMNLMPFSPNMDPPPACDVSSPSTSVAAETCFGDNLYRDVDDVFNRRASSHPFYTMPNTQNPNDQGGFAKWCYGTGPTFKEGGLAYRAKGELQDAAGNQANSD